MRSIKLLAVVLAFLLLNLSCDKAVFDGATCNGYCYILKGKVVDSLSGQGIPDVKLKLYFDLGNSKLIQQTKLLVDMKTNEQGEYLMTFDASKFGGGHFTLFANHPSYFIENTGGTQILLGPADYNVPKQYDLAMFTPALIKVHIKSSNSFNYTHFNFGYRFSKVGYSNWLNIKGAIDTTITVKTAANIKTQIHWIASGSNVQLDKIDSITVKRNSGTDYSISF